MVMNELNSIKAENCWIFTSLKIPSGCELICLLRFGVMGPIEVKSLCVSSVGEDYSLLLYCFTS